MNGCIYNIQVDVIESQCVPQMIGRYTSIIDKPSYNWLQQTSDLPKVGDYPIAGIR